MPVMNPQTWGKLRLVPTRTLKHPGLMVRRSIQMITVEQKMMAEWLLRIRRTQLSISLVLMRQDSQHYNHNEDTLYRGLSLPRGYGY